MTEQEIIKLAKTNWLAWQGLKELQPDVAAWMEKHCKECDYPYGDEWLGLSPCDTFCNSVVYRLRPDYEPLRYWFDPQSKVIYNSLYKGDKRMMLEVTADYAEYLRKKPDGEWELRKYGNGDTIFTFGLKNGGREQVAGWDHITDTASDRGYRWCKPKQPESGWREYAITRDDRGFCVWTDMGDRWPLHMLSDSPTTLGLFGGVQFEGQNEPYWFMSINMLIDYCGTIMSVAFPHETNTPAVPVKCRFWEARQ